MKFHENILPRYLSVAPLPLALERVLECRIHRQHEFARPILDVGCGDGLLAQVLFAEAIDTGIDPDPAELERARDSGAYNELLACRGDAIPKPDGSYLTILSNSVLEHIPQMEPVLREMHRLLANEGRIYLTVPSDRFDQYTVGSQLLTSLGLRPAAARFRSFFNSFWKHYHYHSPDQWRALAARCGFVTVECYPFNPKRVCLTNDALVPFSILSLIAKTLTGRWILFPGLRRTMARPLAVLGSRVLRNGEEAQDGGLVYLHLKKADPA